MASSLTLVTIALLGFAVAVISGDQQRSIYSSVHEHLHPSSEEDTPTGRADPLPADYQQRRADSKQEMLWKRILKTAYPAGQLPTAAYTPQELAAFTHPEYYGPSFAYVSDEMPEGRQKLSHRYAVVGKIQFEILANSPYTGILGAPGGIGLARLSEAKFDDQQNISPDMAIKVLIDGKPSVNYHTFFNADGQGTDSNYFLRTKSNYVPVPVSPRNVYLDKFFTAGLPLIPGPDHPVDSKTLGLVEIAGITNRGETVTNVIAPFKIVFQPNPALTASNANRTGDFRTVLMEIPPNTVLYDVVAHRQKDSAGIFIGRLISRSNFVASRYGDEVLFFQHTRKPWYA
jgi:hypothetical protein